VIVHIEVLVDASGVFMAEDGRERGLHAVACTNHSSNVTVSDVVLRSHP